MPNKFQTVKEKWKKVNDYVESRFVFPLSFLIIVFVLFICFLSMTFIGCNKQADSLPGTKSVEEVDFSGLAEQMKAAASLSGESDVSNFISHFLKIMPIALLGLFALQLFIESEGFRTFVLSFIWIASIIRLGYLFFSAEEISKEVEIIIMAFINISALSAFKCICHSKQ